MKRVTGIGGIFFKSDNPDQLYAWYEKHLGMQYMLAFAENRVPSTHEPHPYMHVFLDAGAGNIIAFFELPNSPPMGRDPNTPDWVQHIAFRVKDEATMLEAKAKAEARGCSVVGPTDHGVFRSVYFFDPSGNRLEVTHWTARPGQLDKLKAIAPAMLDEWDRTIALNLRSAFLCSKAAIPHLKKSKAGRIINVSSISGRTLFGSTSPAYAASKAGIIQLTRFLAIELGPSGITSNSIAPITTPRIRCTSKCPASGNRVLASPACSRSQ